MRFSSLLTLALAMHVVAQSSSGGPDEPGQTIDPEPKPEPTRSEPEPTPKPTLEPTFTNTQATETSKSTEEPPKPTSTPPSGGGATCVQTCLAQAASQVGCKSSADLSCICKSGSYITAAQSCFKSAACDDAAVQGAANDYTAACVNTGPSTDSSSRQPTNTYIPGPTPAPTRTRSYASILTALTTQTLAVTSGAVITFSGSATTITSGFTTVRTGQLGDFASNGGVEPRPTSDSGSSSRNGAAGKQGVAGIMLGLGVVSAVAVLVI